MADKQRSAQLSVPIVIVATYDSIATFIVDRIVTDCANESSLFAYLREDFQRLYRCRCSAEFEMSTSNTPNASSCIRNIVLGANYKKILRLSYDVIITYDNRKSNLR